MRASRPSGKAVATTLMPSAATKTCITWADVKKSVISGTVRPMTMEAAAVKARPATNPIIARSRACTRTIRASRRLLVPIAFSTPYSRARSIVAVYTVSPITVIPTTKPIRYSVRRIGRNRPAITLRLFAVISSRVNASTPTRRSSRAAWTVRRSDPGVTFTRKYVAVPGGRTSPVMSSNRTNAYCMMNMFVSALTPTTVNSRSPTRTADPRESPYFRAMIWSTTISRGPGNRSPSMILQGPAVAWLSLYPTRITRGWPESPTCSSTVREMIADDCCTPGIVAS